MIDNETENVTKTLTGGKLFIILWLVSIAIMYFLASKPGNPLVLPGDIYTRKGMNKIYIPLGSSFFLAVVLYFLAKFFLKI